MANCHNLFLDFKNTITLSKPKKDNLKISRRDLRKKIRKYFKEKKENEIQPKFSGQGSFMMGTIINPITRKKTEEDGTVIYLYHYDIDDGIYFIGNEAPGVRKSIQTYHKWICEAVDGHTNTTPKDKNTCVRVLFADGHNIDLPIYYKQNHTPELAHKSKGWIDSDPKEFSDWFNDLADNNPQLRRIVKYLKAWSDYRKFFRTDKPMPCGLILTILAANHYYKHDRDDIAFKETLINIEAALKTSFRCERPTTPKGENLLEEYNCKDYFLGCLANLIKNAKAALEEQNQKKSCSYWQDSFGDRFPCHLAKDENQKNSNSAGLAAGTMGSRPWGGGKF